MEDKTQNSRLRIPRLEVLYSPFSILHFLLCVLCCASFIFPASNLQAQEEETTDEDKITDLPPVKIEIVDTTQIDIPREKFRSFAKPDRKIYVPLSQKERPWYLPPTSLPEKIREASLKSEREFLFAVTAYTGVPATLAYQMLLVRGFDNSEALLEMGRATPRSDRTAKLASDTTKGLSDFAIDRFKGAFAYQNELSSLKTDLQYNSKDLGYLDADGEEYPNDRSMIEGRLDWGQRLSDNVQSSLNVGVSNMTMEGSFPDQKDSGLDVDADFGIRVSLTKANPVDFGLGVEYLAADSDGTDFSEAMLRLYLRDSYVRLWRFILGIGFEFAVDSRKNPAEGENWVLDFYPNPYVLLTSQFGSRTSLKLGVERSVLKQDLRKIYLESDYMRFRPDVNVEQTWDFNAAIQYKLVRKLTATIGAFDKEIKDLVIYKKTDDTILSWVPESLESERIIGFRAEWELSLVDDKLKQSFRYVHEIHDQQIPYRPNDIASLTIMYIAPFGLETSIAGEFNGNRYIDGDSSESLANYFLLRPRISKNFGRYASVFVSAEFYAGKDDYQVWKEYVLPSQIVDFGLTLKF